MKIQTTLILLGLLLAVAQGNMINWAGNWDISKTESDAACYPDTTILIEQAVGKITASWVWAKTQPCKDAEIAGQKFTQTVDNPQGHSIDLKITVKRADIDGTFTVTEDTAVFVSKNGASATCLRRQDRVFWTGIWDIVTQDDAICNPDKSIALNLDGFPPAYVYAKWTWANSAPCQKLQLAGQEVYKRINHPEGNAAIISFQVGSAIVEGMFAVINDQAVFVSSLTGTSATFVRRQELVNWVGTWDISKIIIDDYCYPDKFVTILPSGSNLIASWTWQNSVSCTHVGLAAKSFTQSLPVPRGSALPLNFIVGGAYVSGLVIVEDDQAIFTSNPNGFLYANRRPQMVNWAGAWEIATQDKTACYPEGSINVAQTSTDITFSWIWAKTSPCTTLGLAGNKFNKTITTPTGNSVKLDISTTASALFTVFLDGAVFSTNGGASTYNRKQENVKFVGTWNIDAQQAGTACFPDTSIIITQDSGSVTAKWTWANSVHCQNAGLAGNEFAQTEPTPKGRAIFLDVLIQTTRISGIFTVNGDQATFASNNGASAAFNRKSSSDSSTDPKNDTPTEPSKEPSTDSKSGSSTGIIAIIVIVVLAIGAYFYVQKTKGKKLVEDLNVSLSGIYAQH